MSLCEGESTSVCVLVWGGGAKLIWGLIPPYGSSSINDPHRLRHRAKSHLTLNLSYLFSLCLSTHPLILRARIKEPERNKESHLVMHIKGESGTIRLCACVCESLRVILWSTRTHNVLFRVATKTTQHSSPQRKHSWPKTQHTEWMCECMCGVSMCVRKRVGMWVFVCLITILGSAWYGLCVF